MGTKRTGGSASLDDLKVKVRRGSAPPCGPQLVGYLSCLDAKGGNNASCTEMRLALDRCMALAGPKPKKQHKPPINYFLQQVAAARDTPARHTTAHIADGILVRAAGQVFQEEMTMHAAGLRGLRALCSCCHATSPWLCRGPPSISLGLAREASWFLSKTD